MTQKFQDTLLKIAIYLIGDNRKASLVIDCFMKQEVNLTIIHLSFVFVTFLKNIF